MCRTLVGYELRTQTKKETDQMVLELSRMKGIRSLSFDFTRITNESLDHLTKLKNLQELGIPGTSITNAGVKHIKKLKTLKWLCISYSSITHDGLKELQEALPKCEILHDSRQTIRAVHHRIT